MNCDELKTVKKRVTNMLCANHLNARLEMGILGQRANKTYLIPPFSGYFSSPLFTSSPSEKSLNLAKKSIISVIPTKSEVISVINYIPSLILGEYIEY